MVKFIHPNQEIFVGEFQNDLKEGHFNECLAQMSASLLAEVVTREKYYIKGEQSNTEKKANDVKKHVANVKAHNIRQRKITPCMSGIRQPLSEVEKLERVKPPKHSPREDMEGGPPFTRNPYASISKSRCHGT